MQISYIVSRKMCIFSTSKTSIRVRMVVRTVQSWTEDLFCQSSAMKQWLSVAVEPLPLFQQIKIVLRSWENQLGKASKAVCLAQSVTTSFWRHAAPPPTVSVNKRN